MFYRLFVACIVLWVPIHLYHFRGAQLVYLGLMAALLAFMALQHVAAGLTHVLNVHVLGEPVSIHDTHLRWYSTTTRGGCGRPCMMMVELAASFCVVRLVLMRRAVSKNNGALAILGAWPIDVRPAATATATTTVPLFLRHLEFTDTLLDQVLGRTVMLPLLLCALFNVVPSFAITILITEIPLVARATGIWWVQFRLRYRADKATKEDGASAAAASASAAGAKASVFFDTHAVAMKLHQLLSRHFSEFAISFTLPTVVLVNAYALAVGAIATMILQLRFEAVDWGPHDISNGWITGAMAVHLVGTLVSAVRVCRRSVARIVTGRGSSAGGARGGAATATVTHPSVIASTVPSLVTTDKTHVC